MEASNHVRSRTNRQFPCRICIPYADKSMGGMYTFLGYFRRHLEEIGIGHTQSMWKRYDVLFLNSFMTSYSKVRLAKLCHPRAVVVHRIDGSAEDYGRGAQWDVIQAKVNSLSGLTIFQSQYSRYATREKFKVIGCDGPVIHNPVDVELFRPEENQSASIVTPRVAFVSFSTNPNKGTQDVLEIAAANTDITFVFAGRMPSATVPSNVEVRGHLDRGQVADMLRECHFFVFFSRNEACPNVVLEAMASGLPVLYLDSGATGEIVGDTGRAVTRETFRAQLDSVLADWQTCSRRARERAVSCFSMDKIMTRYIEVISSARCSGER